MLSKQEFLDLANEWQLAPEVVEKDYVIGWLLWGISTEDALHRSWVFKGGTCLKKCFFETYRFSEDLDFTVLPNGPFRAAELIRIFPALLRRVQDASGIDLLSRDPLFKDQPDGYSSQGRAYYRSAITGQHQRVKLDITSKEVVVRPPVLRNCAHPYSDTFPQQISVRCYAFEEVFAEKIRALAERCRPRDLYDVINLFRRSDLHTAPNLIYSVLREKCKTKGIPVPELSTIADSPFSGELHSEWANMLVHQLPQLPPIESFLEELKAFWDWLTGKGEAISLAPVPVLSQDVTAWRPPPTVWRWGQGVPIEAIRFAAANRLCLDLGYSGTIRRIEPYSLRRTRDGNLLLYAWKVSAGEIRAYRVDRIQNVQVTTQPYRARFAVEFGAAGPVGVADTSLRESWANEPRQRLGRSGPPPLRHHFGPVYVYQCPYCQKEFRHTKNDRTLRQHKDEYGHKCHGKTGFLVRIDH